MPCCIGWRQGMCRVVDALRLLLLWVQLVVIAGQSSIQRKMVA